MSDVFLVKRKLQKLNRNQRNNHGSELNRKITVTIHIIIFPGSPSYSLDSTYIFLTKETNILSLVSCFIQKSIIIVFDFFLQGEYAKTEKESLLHMCS